MIDYESNIYLPPVDRLVQKECAKGQVQDQQKNGETPFPPCRGCRTFLIQNIAPQLSLQIQVQTLPPRLALQDMPPCTAFQNLPTRQAYWQDIPPRIHPAINRGLNTAGHPVINREDQNLPRVDTATLTAVLRPLLVILIPIVHQDVVGNRAREWVTDVEEG